MGHALLLNASFEPLHVVPWQRALQLLFQGKVEVVEESEQEVRTVRITIKVPAVLRLIKYIPIAKKKQIVRFSRTNIFLRDRNACQYCGKVFSRAHLTLDHVVPQVQGGKSGWDNIVTACKPCNQRKGGRTPQQANMGLIKKPKQPFWLPATSFEFGVTRTPEQWKIYLRLDRHYAARVAAGSGHGFEDDFDDDPDDLEIVTIDSTSSSPPGPTKHSKRNS